MANILRAYHIEAILQEDMLGTVAKDPEVYATYIADKEAKRVELEGGERLEIAIPPEPEGKGWTGFYNDNQGNPVLMDYQIKGFIKEAGNTIKAQVGVKNLRSHIDNELFVFPRRIKLAEKVDGVNERPLRAMTMQGPRVTLMRSDFISEGTPFAFDVKILTDSQITEDVLRACLDYGELKGLGQWRNASWGRFTYELNEK